MKRDEVRMWRRISLKNYRSIGSANVTLAPFTVVVGPNGSGKSNFVDALALASEIDSGEDAIEQRGGISAVRRWGIPDTEETRVTMDVTEQPGPSPGRLFHQSFSLLPDPKSGWRFGDEECVWRENDELLYRYARKADGRLFTGPSESPSEAELLPPTRSVMVELHGRFVPWGLGTVLYLRPDLEKMRAPQRARTNLTLAGDGSNIAAVLDLLLLNEETAAFITQAMRRLIPGLERISVGELSRFSIIELEQRHAAGMARFSAADMSDGALRALCIIVASRMLRPWDLLIVEEPEVSIHPEAAAVLYDVLKLASGEGGAVLVTSHSPEFLDAARDEQILVCRYRKGTTHIGPLASEQRQVVRDGLFSLSELMRSEPLRIEGEGTEAFDPSDSTP